MVDIPAIFLGMPVTRKGIRRPSGNAYFRIATIRPEASRLSGKSCVAYNCSQHGTYLRLIENLRENLSVERLAKRMGISSRNFTRVCLRETRMNPGQFVDRMRVEAAQQMIDSSRDGSQGDRGCLWISDASCHALNVSTCSRHYCRRICKPL